MAINLNTFRIFLAVYESRSMTAAAAELHLTQSGISQHIRALEEELGFRLFERMNKKLYPSAQAVLLYQKGRKGVQEIEQAVHEAKRTEETPRGVLRIGMPVEFGSNVVIPELARLGQQYPELDFDITLDFATVLSKMVLRGELDLALIDHFRVDKALKVEPVASETLLLCGLKSYVKAFGPIKFSTAYFSRMNYVDYTTGEPITRSWFRHHLHRQKIDLRVRAHIFDVQGIAKFISAGLGVGVLPQHAVEKLQEQGVDLQIFEGKRTPLRNEISMIYLPLKDRPASHRLVMEKMRKLGSAS